MQSLFPMQMNRISDAFTAVYKTVEYAAKHPVGTVVGVCMGLTTLVSIACSSQPASQPARLRQRHPAAEWTVNCAVRI